MLKVQNNQTFLTIYSDSAESNFSFSLEALVEGQTLQFGYSNDKGDHKMANLTVLSFTSHKDGSADFTWTNYESVSLEVEIKTPDDEGESNQAQKYTVELKQNEVHQVHDAEA